MSGMGRREFVALLGGCGDSMAARGARAAVADAHGASAGPLFERPAVMASGRPQARPPQSRRSSCAP